MLCWCFKERHACVEFHFNIWISLFHFHKQTNIEYNHTVVINYIHINCFCCWIYVSFLIERNTIFFSYFISDFFSTSKLCFFHIIILYKKCKEKSLRNMYIFFCFLILFMWVSEFVHGFKFLLFTFSLGFYR